MFGDTPTPCLENRPNFFEKVKKKKKKKKKNRRSSHPRSSAFSGHVRLSRLAADRKKEEAAYGPGIKSTPSFSKSSLRAWSTSSLINIMIQHVKTFRGLFDTLTQTILT